MPLRVGAAESLDETELHVRGRIRAAGERQARARQALDLLLEQSRAGAGHLFLFADGFLFPAASSDVLHNPQAVLEAAQRRIDSELRRASTDAVTIAQASLRPSAQTTSGGGSGRLTPVLLTDKPTSRH